MRITYFDIAQLSPLVHGLVEVQISHRQAYFGTYGVIEKILMDCLRFIDRKPVLSEIVSNKVIIL